MRERAAGRLRGARPSVPTAATALLAVALVLALATPAWAVPSQSADTSFPDTDGYVYAIASSGSVIYIGGAFTQVGGKPRANVAAISSDGTVLSWNPGANRAVHALDVASDGSVFLGGDFSRIAGQRRPKVARVSSSGSVMPFRATVSGGRVQALETIGSTLYVGGRFTSVNGTARSYLAAVDASSGDLRSWNPAPDGHIWDLESDGSDLWVAGKHFNIGGVSSRGIAEIRIDNGQATAFRSRISRPAYDLALTPGRAFLAAGGGGGAVITYAVDTSSGNIVWTARTDGDMQAVDATSTTVYVGGHQSLIEGQSRANLAALRADTGAVLSWNPGADGGKGPFEILVTPDALLVGGQFTRAGGEPRGGLVRFAGTP